MFESCRCILQKTTGRALNPLFPLLEKSCLWSLENESNRLYLLAGVK